MGTVWVAINAKRKAVFILGSAAVAIIGYIIL
jgi:hypothetical protein